jgi:hypothetical protein
LLERGAGDGSASRAALADPHLRNFHYLRGDEAKALPHLRCGPVADAPTRSLSFSPMRVGIE